MARPRNPDFDPALLERAGLALFGREWKQPTADALSVGRSTIRDWMGGRMRPPPGIRAELATLLRERAAECAAAAEALEAEVGNLHGLTRRELALLGWMAGDDGLDEVLTDRPPLPGTLGWLRLQAGPAGSLRNWAAGELGDGIEGGRIKLADGEADRLLTALGRLTDAQALEVAAAARDVDDLTRDVPED